MLPSKLLRFKDLTCVSITNWPTLKRRVMNDGFPAGRYIGSREFGLLRRWTNGGRPGRARHLPKM